MKIESNDFLSDLLTMKELLLLLRNQYSKHTVYRWIQRDHMPHVKIKGKLWFPKSKVCQWIQRSCQ
ncbi:MAG: helix-turn-helix domain-containing protein [Oligoflexia bacterium]|nr:helix-turn-helix domain-containing protein [Oligoflexia bacterium]